MSARSARTPVEVVERRPLVGSTFPVEIVRVRTAPGRLTSIFCKYEAGRAHEGFGHRGGVGYEADVYARILRPLGLSTPALIGRHMERGSGDSWLFIEAVDGLSIANAPGRLSPAALRRAAAWIGRLHRDLSAETRRTSFLRRYDADYFRGFVDRAWRFSAGHRRRLPWLRSACARADEFIAQLVDAPSTVVHGEFYPGNVIVVGTRTCPVDWESTAIGAGELDLAALIEGWPHELAADCRRRYAAARWPAGAPISFPRTLAAAGFYWAFRWLGSSRRKFAGHATSEVRLRRLQDQAARWDEREHGR
jgi:aminoglycoside phosphotransferase (APT) family kinase protein